MKYKDLKALIASENLTGTNQEIADALNATTVKRDTFITPNDLINTIGFEATADLIKALDGSSVAERDLIYKLLMSGQGLNLNLAGVEETLDGLPSNVLSEENLTKIMETVKTKTLANKVGLRKVYSWDVEKALRIKDNG